MKSSSGVGFVREHASCAYVSLRLSSADDDCDDSLRATTKSFLRLGMKSSSGVSDVSAYGPK